MYLIELIIKKFTQRKEKTTYNPVSGNGIEEIEDYESCEHVFMPVDSIGEILSCTKCGMLVKRSELESELKKELKKKNFFIQDK